MCSPPSHEETSTSTVVLLVGTSGDEKYLFCTFFHIKIKLLCDFYGTRAFQGGLRNVCQVGRTATIQQAQSKPKRLAVLCLFKFNTSTTTSVFSNYKISNQYSATYVLYAIRIARWWITSFHAFSTVMFGDYMLTADGTPADLQVGSRVQTAW